MDKYKRKFLSQPMAYIATQSVQFLGFRQPADFFDPWDQYPGFKGV